jgi:hypothetical protein
VPLRPGAGESSAGLGSEQERRPPMKTSNL